MNEKKLSELTNEELLEEAKKMKRSAFTHAFLIGFVIAMVVFSIAKSTWGFFTLVLLYFLYKMVNKPNNNKELRKILKERNLG